MDQEPSTRPELSTGQEPSSRKAEANRRNAQKSTGPKTPAGKRTVARNAIKHGLLSRYAVVPESDGPGAKRQFEELIADLRVELSPVGTLEDVLVERIANSMWKLRRAAAHENLDMSQMRTRRAAQSHDYHRKSLSEYVELMSFLNEEFFRGLQSRRAGDGWGWYSLPQDYRDKVSKTRNQLWNNVFGLVYLRNLLASVRKQVTRGSFSEDTLHKLLLYLGTADWSLGVRLISVLEESGRTDGLQSTVKRLSPAPTAGGPGDGILPIKDVAASKPTSTQGSGDSINDIPAGIKPRVLAEIDQEIKHFEFLSKQLDWSRNVNLEPVGLPDEKTTNRLMRYESAIEKQLYRALSELERRQRARESASSPTNADLGSD